MTTEDPVEAEMLAEVNEVYHKYGRYPTHHGYWTPGPGRKASEHHSVATAEIRDHSHPDTTTPGTRPPQ